MSLSRARGPLGRRVPPVLALSSVVRLLPLLLGLPSASAAAAPPIQSPLQAMARLRAGDPTAGARAVEAACRGRYRRVLVDDPKLLAEVRRMVQGEDPARRRAGLDLHRCFSPARFVTAVLAPEIRHPDPARAAYAAEVAARLADPAALPPLLEALEARREACAGPLPPPEVERCVWLVYAPGTALDGAPEARRARVGALAAEATTWPHPKAREVAVETLAATGDAAHAKVIRGLVAREKKGDVEAPNPPPLLRRFEQRARELAR